MGTIRSSPVYHKTPLLVCISFSSLLNVFYNPGILTARLELPDAVPAHVSVVAVLEVNAVSGAYRTVPVRILHAASRYPPSSSG